MVIQEAFSDSGKDCPIIRLWLGLEEGVLVGLRGRDALIEVFC
jgi:hypothetical protein